MALMAVSHPTRVRGLKLLHCPYSNQETSSHPTRVRGLKLRQFLLNITLIQVAPHAGAWIETTVIEVWPYVKQVAPHAGAWIETGEHIKNSNFRNVAPHAGAWIETSDSSFFAFPKIPSHPTRVRGLL